MEIITVVKVNTSLKGREFFGEGVYTAPIPDELLAEERAGTLTRDGRKIVEVLETKHIEPVVPFVPTIVPVPQAPTSISSVVTSNLREGKMYEEEQPEPQKFEAKDIINPWTTTSTTASSSTTSTTVKVKAGKKASPKKARKKASLKKAAPVLKLRG